DSVTNVNGITMNTFTISCVPTSATNFTITVADNGGATVSQPYQVSVIPATARTFVVNTTADLPALPAHDPACDEDGDISFRSAIEASDDDAFTGEPQFDTIIMPAGDYSLDSSLDIQIYANIQNEPGVSPDQIRIAASPNFITFGNS